ncbi:FecR family protein [Alteromonas sp. 1_MG-2023]|uniref:FecR family protein n=1 Tax=Alteromonas sp. 1_MG-2023 TaxID=3062669 RepID=UPI0026E2F433|nr:FecR family protein [Alteromonas sp. 1_MG-2023]MDO6477565.1 FecR family protein [Alteromonas sp. 1_MG-2023]
MSRVLPFNKESESQQRRREASAWVVKLNEGDLSDEESLALKAWLKQDQANVAELKRLSATWDKMSDLREDLSTKASGPNATLSLAGRIFKIAACFLALLLIPLTVYLQQLTVISSTNGEYFTVVGKQRTVSLSDGSQIILNTNTRINVKFTRRQRDIELVQGEANFDVAADKARPFVVKVGSGDVRALGTSFSIRKSGQFVNVLVSHGTVKVSANGDDYDEKSTSGAHQELNSSSTVVVSAGKEVVFDEVEVESVMSATSEDMNKKLYWKKGFLAFDDESLSRVVEELSRYTDMKIVIVDQGIKELRVGGYYPIDNLDTVFASLELNLGLRVKKVNSNAYYIMKS